MLDFKTPTLSDKAWVKELLGYSDFRGCEYTFGNIFCWRDIYDIKICRFGDFLFIKNSEGLYFPAGRGDIGMALHELKDYCEKNSLPFYFTTMNKLSMLTLKEIYGEKAQVDTSADFYDYIYSRDDLAELRGKKYHAKRNHIARFSENDWSSEPITSENIAECEKMNDEWCERNICINGVDDSDKRDEICAVRTGLRHFAELDYFGELLRVNGTVQAFSFGERVNSDAVVVHVEKALTDIQGTYPMINKQFVLNHCADVRYINREEDMGEENLRKAKLSYYPCFMEEKFSVNIV